MSYCQKSTAAIVESLKEEGFHYKVIPYPGIDHDHIYTTVKSEYDDWNLTFCIINRTTVFNNDIELCANRLGRVRKFRRGRIYKLINEVNQERFVKLYIDEADQLTFRYKMPPYIDGKFIGDSVVETLKKIFDAMRPFVEEFDKFL